MSNPDAYYEAQSDKAAAFDIYKESDQYILDLIEVATDRLLNDEDFRDDVLTEVMIYDMTKLAKVLIEMPEEFGKLTKIYALDRAKHAVVEQVERMWEFEYDAN